VPITYWMFSGFATRCRSPTGCLVALPQGADHRLDV
jgi:hypothetical protein